MKLNELAPNAGSNKKKMRVGRGIGSGKGKTSGRGGKGQTARTGVSINGFEGGQMPLHMRLPKLGFNNIFAKKFTTVTLARLQDAIDSKKLDAKKPIDEAALVQARVVRRKKDGIRLLGTGTLKAKIDLTISGATATAKEAVEKAGGSLTIIERKVAPVVRKKPKKNAS